MGDGENELENGVCIVVQGFNDQRLAWSFFFHDDGVFKCSFADNAYEDFSSEVRTLVIHVANVNCYTAVDLMTLVGRGLGCGLERGLGRWLERGLCRGLKRWLWRVLWRWLEWGLWRGL